MHFLHSSIDHAGYCAHAASAYLEVNSKTHTQTVFTT